jgi:hypothetical protein
MTYTIVQLRLIQINATLVMGGDKTIDQVRADIQQGVIEEIERRYNSATLNSVEKQLEE